MQRVTDVVGKAIVAAESGEQVGRVADLLLDADGHQVVGLVVAGGLLASEQVVPFSEIQTLGRDAVLVKTASGVVGRKAWREQAVTTSRSSSLRDKPVITDAGRALGRVRDVHLNETTGAIEALEIGEPGLVQRRSVLPQSHLRIGPDAIIVPDSDAPAK